jgi:small subunit ribosomal protein S20
MPHTRSAKKNLRKAEKRRLRNRSTVKAIKTQIKRFLAAVGGDGPLDAAQQEYNLAAKRLDKAAARRIIHPNLAARKKSQLALALQKKKTAPPKTEAPPA